MRITTRNLQIAGLLLLVAAHSAAQQPAVAVEEYALIDYYESALNNPVAELADRLETGATTLTWQEGNGYFEDFLEELDIDPDSQVLVFSKTSLQYPLISAKAPRAIYFNDQTYIGWVKNSDIVEVATMDEKFGIVFYVFNNRPDAEQPVERLNQKCLVCHDTYGLMGGGVPVLMVRSSVYSTTGQNLLDVSGEGNSEDDTPLEDRWGGWYVTGQHGDQQHLGNVQLPGPGKLAELDDYRIGNIDSLEGTGFFDTEPYLRSTSDLVGLMVMEHQVEVQNELTYVKFKAPVVLERLGMGESRSARHWQALPDRAQKALTRMLDSLADSLFMADAITLTDPVSGNAGFRDSFEARGPFDSSGRSLRELDLESRLFRYQLSFLVYSSDFMTLPAYAKDYLVQKIIALLEGRDDSSEYAHLTAQDRRAIAEILAETHPDFRALGEMSLQTGLSSLKP